VLLVNSMVLEDAAQADILGSFKLHATKLVMNAKRKRKWKGNNGDYREQICSTISDKNE
jgi:hypothetical protein